MASEFEYGEFACTPEIASLVVSKFSEDLISRVSYTGDALYGKKADIDLIRQASEEISVEDQQSHLKAQLMAYANQRQWALATGGFTLSINGNACLFLTDAVSQGLITGKAVRLSQPNPPATVEWQFSSGFQTINSDDFLKAASAIADFVQATFDTLKDLLEKIDSGEITSHPEIDQAPWPASQA